MMGVPPEYLQVGIFLDLFSFLITLLVAVMAYRLYSIFRAPKYVQFSIGFFIMSISYLFFAFINYFSYVQETQLSAFISDGFANYLTLSIQIRNAVTLVALIILIFLYYDIHDRALQSLMSIFLVFIFFLAGADDYVFSILSAMLFLFIIYKIYQHYRRAPDKNTLFALMGFCFLILAKGLAAFIFLNSTIYLVSYLFKLAGFLLILYSLWVISR